jgi:bifunctional UDP-N-acetylglucosamine pyrophosphorylase/glucosamine-1-phosphate N-acetyltransferase/UDP-N-acetylglucosamine pyrophosphorylase
MDPPLAIVLAAGKGTRMRSDLPKVLFEARGRPLVAYVLDALVAAGVHRIAVVVGYRAQDVIDTLSGTGQLEFVEQTEQLGTGHAVQTCGHLIARHDGPVVVLAGDSPLTQADSLKRLLDEFHRRRPACILGTLHKPDPAGLGRIVRNEDGQFAGIVEEKDATEQQLKITEVNMSTYVFDSQRLRMALDQLDNNNRQGEYYVTDCPGILKRAQHEVLAMPVLKPCEALSVNTLEELKIVEEELSKMGL